MKAAKGAMKSGLGGGVLRPQGLDGLRHYGGVWWVGFLEEAMLGTQGR